MTRANFLRRLVLPPLLALTLYFLLAWGICTTLTSRVPGANDFLSRWAGARALLLRGENPYSDQVTREIQIQMYGRPARADQDQVAFAYPLYAAFLVAPLIGLPYAQAQALWMSFLVMAVVTAVLVLGEQYGLGEPVPARLKPLLTGALVLGALLFYPAVRGFFLGQFTLFVFACVALALASVRAGREVEAGILLAVATVKPQPVLFLVPVILVWAALHRRWRIVAGAGVTLALLVGAALVLAPTWLADFVDGIREYSVYEPVGPPVQTLAESLVPPMWSAPLYLAAAVAFVGWMLWRVLRTLALPWDKFQPTLAIVALVTVFMAGRVGTPDQMLVLIPWLLWLGAWLRRGQWYLALAAALGLVVAPWLVFFATVIGDAEHVGVTLVLPCLTLALYLLHLGKASWRSARPIKVARRRFTD